MVSSVQFDDDSALLGAKLRFTVVHPGSGVVFVNNSCFFVRGTNSDGAPQAWESSWTYPKGPETWGMRLNDLKSKMDQLAWTFFFPYRTTYFLRVELLGGEMIKAEHPPRVKSLRIDFASSAN